MKAGERSLAFSDFKTGVRKMRKRTVWLIFLLSVTIFAFNVRVDPILLSKTVSQGDRVTASIYVDNADDFETLNFEVFVADVVQNREGGYVVVPAGSTDYSAAKWITVKPTRLSIQPKRTGKVDLQINVPRGVTGGRYAAIVLKFLANKEELTGMEDAVGFGLMVDYQIASFVELNVDGTRRKMELYAADLTMKKIGEIASLAEVRKAIGDDANVFIVTVINRGNIHVQASGELTIKTKDGKTLAKFPLGSGNILPEAEVELRSITSRQFPPGTYSAKVIINYGGYRPAVLETELNVAETEIVSQIQKQSGAPMIFVEPSNVELKCLPSAFRSVTVEIFNRGKETINVLGSIYPLVYDTAGELIPVEQRGQVPTWIEISPNSFQLKPNQSRKVRISARPPKDVNGGYYFDVLFTAVTENLRSEQGTNLLVFVGKDEEMIEKYSVQFARIAPTEQGIGVDLLVKNEGNVHVLPSIVLGLERVLPQREENGVILPETTERLISASYKEENPILPGTQRLFMVVLEADLKSGDYELIVRLESEKGQQVIGKQRIRIERGE